MIPVDFLNSELKLDFEPNPVANAMAITDNSGCGPKSASSVRSYQISATLVSGLYAWYPPNHGIPNYTGPKSRHFAVSMVDRIATKHRLCLLHYLIFFRKDG